MTKFWGPNGQCGDSSYHIIHLKTASTGHSPHTTFSGWTLTPDALSGTWPALSTCGRQLGGWGELAPPPPPAAPGEMRKVSPAQRPPGGGAGPGPSTITLQALHPSRNHQVLEPSCHPRHPGLCSHKAVGGVSSPPRPTGLPYRLWGFDRSLHLPGLQPSGSCQSPRVGGGGRTWGSIVPTPRRAKEPSLATWKGRGTA